MRMTIRLAGLLLVTTLWLVPVSALSGCEEEAGGSVGDGAAQPDAGDSADSGADGADADAEEVGPTWEPLALEPSQGFLDRQAEYLALCADAHGPGKGGLHGQSCAVATGKGVNEEAIDNSIAKLGERKDTSDFDVASLLRILYLDREKGALGPEVRARIEGAVRSFKYWLDEPGQDKMCYWTENHQILYHSNELLAGQLFPDEVFTNASMTGAEHVEHALPRLLRWLELRGEVGFSEWHSNVYFNEDMPALTNLAHFAADENVRIRARAVLDIMALDLASNYFHGLFATVHGRTYSSKLVGGLSDSTDEAAWIMLGLGEYKSAGNFTGAFLATGDRYFPPPLLEEIAAETAESHEHRQRDSFDVADGPTFGVGYESTDDIVVWAGMAGLMAPDVVLGTAAFLDRHDLWDGFLFGDLPEDIKNLLETLASTGGLKGLAEEMEKVSRGIALESMSTYTYRTAHYQLSGAQDHKPGFWGAQTHPWQATLDRQAYVFTTFPADFGAIGGDFQTEFGSEWTGSWLPRVTLHRNVGVIRYADPSAAGTGDILKSTYNHAMFPRSGFDEVREEGHWTFGRKGDAWLALYSREPTRWADDSDYELIADTTSNTWIVELGSADEQGSFDDFVTAIAAATVAFDEVGGVSYDSPSQGTIEVGWEGPMIAAGVPVDLGPFERWDNAYASQPWGDPLLVVQRDDVRLELNVKEGLRRLSRRIEP